MGKTFLTNRFKTRRSGTWLLFFALALVALTSVSWVAYSQAAKPAAPAEVFSQYCVTCHNARLKTAGLVIDPADLARVNANPELWEKVVRKLRSTAMPPAGSPRAARSQFRRASRRTARSGAWRSIFFPSKRMSGAGCAARPTPPGRTYLPARRIGGR